MVGVGVWCSAGYGRGEGRGGDYDADESCDVKRGEVDEVNVVLLDFAKHWS